MTEEAKTVLRTGLEQMGLVPPQEALDRLDRYGDLLLEKNQVMNLTAITDPVEVARLHFLDSAALLPTRALTDRRVVDVGTGGGFPGLVLKLLEPTIRLTLVDTLGKRVDWLREVCAELGLDDVVCVKGRAEELSRTREHRERYDVAVSRAVAALPLLTELCVPFVAPGGLFLAMKSNKTDDEVDAARPVVAALGGAAPFVMDYDLPGTGLKRRIVAVKKIAATPDRWPRKWAKMKEGWP